MSVANELAWKNNSFLMPEVSKRESFQTGQCAKMTSNGRSRAGVSQKHLGFIGLASEWKKNPIPC